MRSFVLNPGTLKPAAFMVFPVVKGKVPWPE